ncbi:MAG: DMT family transporter [Bacteroidetes bacterium]|nr:DMT family transporter [Bacteroidota bacterium]
MCLAVSNKPNSNPAVQECDLPTGRQAQRCLTGVTAPCNQNILLVYHNGATVFDEYFVVLQHCLKLFYLSTIQKRSRFGKSYGAVTPLREIIFYLPCMNPKPQRGIYIGILLAIITTLIWSGNFIVARAAYKAIPPVSMGFFRWLTATVIILPFAWKKVVAEKNIFLENKNYFFLTAFTGITLFNTCIYVAGHYTPAINLALIGTTSSPIMAVILAAIFLKEKITWQRITGMVICICGILLLMGKGSLQHILLLRFSIGDVWILLSAFFFAIYNVLVRKKPSGISPLAFVGVVFTTGTLILFPFFLAEQHYTGPIHWNFNLFLIILYLGLGNSVISYLCWNAAIARLGTARTALFGNLIPVFSTIEATYILSEPILWIHVISMVIIIIGLIIANVRIRKT